MTRFDVFNGDADGICALHQLRLAHPAESVLVTGVKRDIKLLEKVEAAGGDEVTVLDISLDVNRSALVRLLERGATVEYFDHHFSGAVPAHPRLFAHIDTAPDVCTSILVDRHLGGRHRLWAIVAAFGDNLPAAGAALARSSALQTAEEQALRELGECLNYNAYGDTEADLLIHPARLYELLRPHASPFAFVAAEPALRILSEARRHDLELALRLQPAAAGAGGAVYVLPDAPWARRVRGDFGNRLAQSAPASAHAILTSGSAGGYVVSVRAPLDVPAGADRLCRQFATGGGRAGAAGINHLPVTSLADFVDAFDAAFGAQVPDSAPAISPDPESGKAEF